MNATTDPATGLEIELVNAAAWAPPHDIPEGWLVANAPRPIQGQITWTGEFRHGIFYAASPEVPGGTFGWKADDAYLIQLITNAEIEARIDQYLAAEGYGTPAELEMSYVELAASLGGLELPYLASVTVLPGSADR